MFNGGLMAVMTFSFMALGACTNENKVKDLKDEPISVKGQSSRGSIGINENDEIVVRDERSASDELRIQQMTNSQLASKLDHELHLLKWCRTDMADPRLSGSGKVQAIPEVDNMKPAAEVREKMGLNAKGDLKVRRESYFNEILKGEREYETSLRTMLKVAESHREECELKMRELRVRAGLPGDRYKGKGYFKDGTWVETQRSERSLSDAFEIQAREKADAEGS